MNFALGPMEMANALAENRACRIGAEFSLHLTEVALAIHNAGADNGICVMKTRAAPMQPMPWITQRVKQ